jgi:hypothetical protein
MPAAANIYAHALVKAFGADIDLTTDTIKMALLTGGYTPDLINHADFSDVASAETSGAGYTPGGVTLAATSLTLTAANSWGVTWASGTAYAYGAVVIPPTPNGFLYRCVAAGTSGGSPPSFPTTVGQTVADNTAEWACMGDAILVFTSDSASWTAATFTADYAVIYDAESGTYSSEPLLVLQTFSGPASPAGITYEVTPDPVLGWFYFSPPS